MWLLLTIKAYLNVPSGWYTWCSITEGNCSWCKATYVCSLKFTPLFQRRHLMV